MSFNISDNNSKQQVAKLLSDTEKAFRHMYESLENKIQYNAF